MKLNRKDMEGLNKLFVLYDEVVVNSSYGDMNDR